MRLRYDRVLKFTPPDGEFVVMNYRITKEVRELASIVIDACRTVSGVIVRNSARPHPHHKLSTCDRWHHLSAFSHTWRMLELVRWT